MLILAIVIPFQHMDSQVGGHDAVTIGAVDTFHEGESLDPAISWLQGGIPYKDFIVLHGIFLDPLQGKIIHFIKK